MIILNKTVWAEDKIAGIDLWAKRVIVILQGQSVDVEFDTKEEAEDAFKQAVIKFKEYTEKVR